MKNTSLVPKVFIDTNVIVDFLLPDRPKHATAREVFKIIYSHQSEAAISTQSILDAAYICGKTPGYVQNTFRETILYMLDRTNASSVDPFDVKTGLRDLNPDIEDNAQISFAYSQCCDIIVTSDKKLLSREVPRPMRVMTPEDFVNACRA